MKFDSDVPAEDCRKFVRALEDIKHYGNSRQRFVAAFVEESEISIYVDAATKVGGSGSVYIDRIIGVNRAISRGELSVLQASAFIRLNIARETIDTGGQRGIEGTFVHEGKHALDFALMIRSFSIADNGKFFDPTAFQREYSAHLTSAFYLSRRGGEYAEEGLSLGILSENGGRVHVSPIGIRERLRNNYGLSAESPGKRLSEISFPNIAPRGTKLWGIF
jgi:hypothetical protein